MRTNKRRCFLFLLFVIGVTPAYPHGFPIMGGLSLLIVIFLIAIFGRMVKLKYRVLSSKLVGTPLHAAEETLEFKRTNRSMEKRVLTASVIEICLFAAAYSVTFALRNPASLGDVLVSAAITSFTSFSLTLFLGLLLFSNKDVKLSLPDLIHVSAALPLRFLLFVGAFSIFFSIITC